MRDGKEGYFEAALSDFVFDVAAGGAIRHLVDRGYSVEQIMKNLDYPVPREKVEKAVYRYLLESGLLLSGLPEERKALSVSHPIENLLCFLAENGEENCYIECPFGLWRRRNEEKLQQIIACLTSREQEYILGIRWEQDIMYHRLNSRMREIAMKLVRDTKEEWRVYCVAISCKD